MFNFQDTYQWTSFCGWNSTVMAPLFAMKSLCLKACAIFATYLLSDLFHSVADTKKLSFCGTAVKTEPEL